MNLSKQLKSVCSAAAFGAVMATSSVNAATIGFGADQVFDSSLVSSFSITLVGENFTDLTYGGGLGITYDSSIVNIASTSIDNFWGIKQEDLTTPGYYEFNATQFGFSTVNTTSQNIVTINFDIVGSGTFDLALNEIGASGVWAYTVPQLVAGEPGSDTTYCLTYTGATDASGNCLGDNPLLTNQGANRDFLTLGTTNITVSAVPVPAAVWLFVSGLAGLVGVSRRKQA